MTHDLADIVRFGASIGHLDCAGLSEAMAGAMRQPVDIAPLADPDAESLDAERFPKLRLQILACMAGMPATGGSNGSAGAADV